MGKQAVIFQRARGEQCKPEEVEVITKGKEENDYKQPESNLNNKQEETII